MTSKTIVLGASGFLGSHFIQQGYPEIYQFRTKPESNIPHHLILDPWKTDELEKVIVDYEFESLVNCIALANIEDCQSNEAKAFEVNSELPRRLAELCKRRSVHFVHVSTDAVLQDAMGILDESSPTNPKSAYGKSKLLGEEQVLKTSPLFTVARVNFFGVSPRRDSLFDFFYNSLKLGNIVLGFSDIFFSPLYIKDTISALRYLAYNKNAGIIHLASSTPISKYEFGLKVAALLGLSTELIVETRAQDLPLGQLRSLNLSINNQKMLTFYQPQFSIEEGILQCIEQRKREDLD
jgi:dTDP-4-dehydrorhamnose reductase